MDVEQKETTPTRIMLERMMSIDGLPQSLRREIGSHGLNHCQAVAMCEQFVREVVNEFMADSKMPDFAQDILAHALEHFVDWRFVGERLITDPESN